jgi:hypothetical protein
MAITHQHGIAVMQLEFCDVIIHAVCMVDKRVIDIERNQS